MPRMTTLKGIFPDPKPIRRKNFIQENVKSLRQMEQYFHNHREIEDLQNLHIHKQQKALNKYHNITSKVNSTAAKFEEPSKKLPSKTLTDKTEKTSHSDQRLSVSNLFSKGATSTKKLSRVGNRNFASIQKKPEKIRVVNKSTVVKNKSKVPSDSTVLQNKSNSDESNKDEIKYRNQGIQTLDDKNLDDLYAEGIIRYATKKHPCKNISEETEKKGKEQFSPPSDRGDCRLPVKNDSEEVNYIKLNKQRNTVASKLATQLNNGVPPSSYRKGVVPKYIRERKEAQLKKEEKAKIDAGHPDCPEGHIPLPDEERRETLRMLKKNYQESVNELNKLPIRVDTLRAQRQKMEIEKQLTKLEEGIKVFSRPKVFVKIDA